MPYGAFQKQDANSPELDRAARGVGAEVLEMPREAGFDRLIAYNGKLYVVEHKDGEKPPSKRRLTPNEERVRDALARAGVDYHVVKDRAELLAVLGWE